MPVFRQDRIVRPDSRAAQVESRNRARRQPLSKFERKALEQGTTPVYIYNVSPIFQWNRLFIGMGNLVLLPRKEDAVVSEPMALTKRIVRNYDAGDNRFSHMIEEPLEIAEDFLRCSKEFPGRDENNLVNFGCFMTVGKKFEELPPLEQDKILSVANLAHDNKCREKVFEADGWASDSVTRRWITEIHRRCALFLKEERSWVTMRGSAPEKAKTKECQFCGFDCKVSAVRCHNCKEILDKAGYDALKKG